MARWFFVLAVCGFAMAVVCVPLAAAEKKMPPKITFDDHVKPIFRQKCASCHNPDKKKGDLDLTNYTGAMTGGGSGEVIEPGDSSGSYLYELVSHAGEPHMPPESPKIPDEMVETIRKWIDGGVLENKGSAGTVTEKKKVNLALSAPSNERPAKPPIPPRLSLRPIVITSKTATVTAMATSPWAPLAAIAGQKQVLLYNTKTLALAGVLPFPEGVAHILRFSRNGGLLLAGGGRGGASGKVVVWSIKTGDRIIEVGDELDAVLSADISSDQSLIALGGPQRVVRIYSTETGRLIHELRKHTDWIESVEFSPDSVLLATGDRSGNLFVWEGTTGREYLTLKGHGKKISAVTWRSDSNILASSSEDGTIRLWEMENGRQIKSWGAHSGGTAWVEFARDGRLVSCGRDRRTKIWQQDGKQIRMFTALDDLAIRTTHCDETNRVISGSWTGVIKVWNAADGKQVGVLSANPPSSETRLAQATTLLKQRKTEHAPKAAAYGSAKLAAEKAQANLAEAKKQMALASTNAATSAATLKTNKTALDEETAAQQATIKQAELLTTAVTVLNEAAQTTSAAARKIPGDKDLATLAAKLVASAAAKKTSLEAAKREVVTRTLARDAAQKAHADSVTANGAVQKSLVAAGQKVAKKTPLVKPAVDRAAVAKKIAEVSSTALSTALNAVDRWQSEIAFSKELDELSQQMGRAQATLVAVSQQQATLEQAEVEAGTIAKKTSTLLGAVQAELAKAQADRKKAMETVNQTTAKNNESLVFQKTLGEQQKIRSEIIELLARSAILAAEAARKASGKDSQLNKTVETIQTTLTEKQKAQSAGAISLTKMAKQIEQLTAQLATAERQSVAMITAISTAQKKVTERTAAYQPLAAKVIASQKALDACIAKLAATKKNVDEILSKIAAAKGISR